jgi:hypothetical protein
LSYRKGFFSFMRAHRLTSINIDEPKG